MGYQYDQYLGQHINNVSRGLTWLETNLPEVLESGHDYATLMYQHDRSKHAKDEYDAYDAYFYGGNRSYHVVSDFKRAWLHHIHHNPHHWQHWVLINDDPNEGTVALDMDYPYIIEMICDWWSFSWTKGDLYEIFNWYDSHKDHMILSRKTRKTVEDILDKIRIKLDSMNTEKNN